MKASRTQRRRNLIGPALALATALSLPAGAQTPDHGKLPAAMPVVSASASAAEMIEGEIRKVDRSAKKITIKHGDIKSLEMPAMTMVFQVRDPALLEQVQAGDKVLFKADKANGAIVVTEIRVVGK